MPSIETYQQVLAAVAACDEKKAEDIRILALDPAESGLSDYFLICNGTNERQNVAITDEVELRMKREFGVYPAAVEGRRQGEWILMDYVDFIVHVFSAEKRQYYGLERLRKSATTVSVDDLDAELKAETLRARERATPVKAKRTAVRTKQAIGEAPVKNAVKTADRQAAGSQATKKTISTKRASSTEAAKPGKASKAKAK